MIQFYKKRDFGAFITDTFNFFKSYGKNFFKNYFLINGLLLILLVAVGVFSFRNFFGQFINGNMAGQSDYMARYFEDNMGMFIVTMILIFLLYSALTVVNFLFPVFYSKRVSEGQTKIKTDEILSDFKKNSGKIFKLYLGLTFLVIPVSFILFLISYVLIFLLIGIVIMLFLVPALFNVITFLTYDYFNSNRGFFESLSYAIRSQFSYPNGREASPYWKYWGSTIIFMIIYYIISMIFTFVPMMMFYSSILTSAPDGSFEQNPMTGTFGVLFFVIYGVAALVSLIVMNLLYINSGLMYYDSRTDLHQKIELAEIDTIGTNE
ncbi:hypothetical protein SAMN05421664_1137 [Chryseobacterium soldanellicola]|uniref:DUF4013 domain-containing protein n=1 Tax=Chryseobacterium soldanellicola TaxID=311333 RepID=A0A1H0ZXP9_9FLAO|nr:DUF4013 domain-containing protein [Chryseobacterium soldanellicola]SDQ32254.1 hypothetical protein SAMN05421664_1137 [Chryseobacterium soldanellicola]